MEKRKGSNIIIPVILRLWGRISSEKKVKEISGKKFKLKKNWGGEEYQVVVTLYTSGLNQT